MPSGIYLAPGSQTVEFRYRQPVKPMYVTLAGFVVTLLLSGYLVVSGRKTSGGTP